MGVHAWIFCPLQGRQFEFESYAVYLFSALFYSGIFINHISDRRHRLHMQSDTRGSELYGAVHDFSGSADDGLVHDCAESAFAACRGAFLYPDHDADDDGIKDGILAKYSARSDNRDAGAAGGISAGDDVDFRKNLPRWNFDVWQTALAKGDFKMVKV